MKTPIIYQVAILAGLAVLPSAILMFNPASATAANRDRGEPGMVAPAQYDCAYVAHFVADVTVPDNTVFAPGTPFTKIWRVRNDGTCTWGSGNALRSLAFVGGTNLSNKESVSLPAQVRPGEQIDIAVPMVAAIYDGRYISEWKLQVDGGPQIGFGPSGQAAIYVQIVVSGDETSSWGICTYYTVQPGDYLKLIAARFGTTWQAIAQANKIYNPNLIYAGMRLAIPCGNGTPPAEGESRSFTSTLYHYAVKAPSGWTIKVNRAVPPGTGSNPEYVTFSAPGRNLPAIDVDVLTGTPPFTGFENCARNLTFHGIQACNMSLPVGQTPAQQLLIFQRGNAYFHMAMRYEDAGALTQWDAFLATFGFTD